MKSEKSKKKADWGEEDSYPSLPDRKRPKTTPYDPAFEQHLTDHGVFLDDYESNDDVENNNGSSRPHNLDAINIRLNEPRGSLSPSHLAQKEFQELRRASKGTRTEMGVVRDILPTILGPKKTLCSGNIELNNLTPLTNGNISHCKPDYFDGSRPAALSMEIQTKLATYIVSCTDASRPCIPNFFIVMKGARGLPAQARLQACYVGAFGARAMHRLRTHVHKDTALDLNAYTISCTLNSGGGGTLLTLYATYPSAPTASTRDVDYHMVQLEQYAMSADVDQFRQGVTALRNARDWASEQRAELIEAANSTIHERPAADQDLVRDSVANRDIGSGLNYSETGGYGVEDIASAERNNNGR